MPNKILLKNINLKDNERIENIVRRSLWSWFWQIIFAAILMLLPFFLIYPLFQLGWRGVAIFALFAFCGLLLVVRIYLSYYFTVFIMTSLRIIDLERNGFFNQLVASALYSKIQEVSGQKRGIIKSFFGLSDLDITLIGEKKAGLKLINIKKADWVMSEIISMQENFLTNRRREAGEKAQYLLNKIKRRVGEDVFNRLIAD